MSLAELRPLVEIMAAERTTSTPHLFDDAVQEGLIAAWKARKARPDAPNSYVVGAARNGVRSVVRGRPGTGQTTSGGLMDAADYVEHADAPESGTTDTYRVELLEVWDAVKRLPSTEARIATLRAYGYEWREVGDRVGLKSEATRRRFVNHIAPRLAAELGHLRSEVASPNDSDSCKRGHPFTPENTGRHTTRGRRYCKTCHRVASSDSQRRLRANERSAA